MTKTKWVMIEPDTVLYGSGWRNEGQTHRLTAEETQHRYLATYDWIKRTRGKNVEYDWVIEYKGNQWSVADSKTLLTEVKIPSMKKEFVTLAVKGSEWEFERDWHFVGYVDSSGTRYTVPAGTRVKIIDNKMRIHWYSPQEKCIIAELTPGLEKFKQLEWNAKIAYAAIPAKEASAYLKLVTAGKTKTYWKLEYGDGTAFRDKRYTSLSAVKASIRVRYGMVQEADSEWATWDGYERPDNSKGIFAVEYDYATDTEIKREDMNKYLFMATLKA